MIPAAAADLHHASRGQLKDRLVEQPVIGVERQLRRSCPQRPCLEEIVARRQAERVLLFDRLQLPRYSRL